LVLSGWADVLAVYRDNLLRYLSIGDSEFGLLLSVGNITGLAGMLVGGVLIDQWRPRRVIRLCLIGAGAAMALIAAAGTSWWMLVLAVGALAVFQRPLGIAVGTFLVHLFPNDRRRVLSLNFAAGSLGGIVFPAAAEGLLQLSQRFQAFSFAMALYWPFLVVAAVLLPSSFLFRRKKHLAVRPPAVVSWSWRDVLLVPWRHGVLVLLLALHSAADAGLYYWMSRFLGSEAFDRHPVAPGLVLSAYSLSYVVSRLALAGLPEDRGRKVLMVLPGLLGGAAVILGLLSRDYLLTAGGYVLGALLWSCEWPVMISVIARERSERFGGAMALVNIASALGMFVSITLLGLFASHVGQANMWKVLLGCACLFPCVGIGGAIWLGYYGRPQARQTPA
jgi:MFS family permease